MVRRSCPPARPRPKAPNHPTWSLRMRRWPVVTSDSPSPPTFSVLGPQTVENSPPAILPSTTQALRTMEAPHRTSEEIGPVINTISRPTWPSASNTNFPNAQQAAQRHRHMSSVAAPSGSAGAAISVPASTSSRPHRSAHVMAAKIFASTPSAHA